MKPPMMRLGFALLAWYDCVNQLFVSPKGSDRGQCEFQKTVRHDRDGFDNAFPQVIRIGHLFGTLRIPNQCRKTRSLHTIW
jgi:hypothetical protein